MYFSIDNPYNKLGTEQLPLIKKHLIRIATKNILITKFGATEKKLDTWCKEQYNCSLKYICIYLIKHAKILVSSSTEFVILFNTLKLDKLARTITYGTGLIGGSPILKLAFNHK